MDESNVNNNNNAKDKSSEVFVPADPEVVRRRLFQEGEENDQSSQEYQCAAESVQICSSSWGNSKHDAASTDKKETEKDKEISNLLLITKNEDISLIELLEDRAEFVLGLARIHHCPPEDALRLCCSTTFKLIFLDLNTDNFESIFRIIVTIRGSAFPNQTVPVVALKHSGIMKEEYWRKYGISDVIYGPLYHSIIEQIINKWLNSRGKHGATIANEATIVSEGAITVSSLKEETDKVIRPIYKQAFTRASSSADVRDGPAYVVDLTQSKLTGSWISSSRHPIPFEGCDSSTCPSTSYATSEYPVPSTIAQNTQTDLSYLQSHPHAQWTTTYSSTTNNPSLVYSDAATVHSVTHSKQPSNIGSVGNSRPVPPLTSTNSTTTPTCTAASSGANNWTLIQQALDIHSQKGDYMHRQRPSQIKGDLRFAGRNTPVSSNSVFNHPTPPLLSGPRPYISYMAPPNVTIPPNASYMINGTPGTPAMRLTLIPEDFQKHSSKERERRERIKACCDEIRRILPSQSTTGRRLDMATVMEMAVNYIKLHQHHLPVVLQQQMNQAFVNLYNSKEIMKKKKDTMEETSMPCNAPPSKIQRIQPAPAYIASCPLGSYTGPTYVPQIIQNNTPTSGTSYYPPMCPPMHLAPAFVGPLTPAPSPVAPSSNVVHTGQTVDHPIPGRQQYVPEYIQNQSGPQCYMPASSAVREPVSSISSKDNAHTISHF